MTVNGAHLQQDLHQAAVALPSVVEEGQFPLALTWSGLRKHMSGS